MVRKTELSVIVPSNYHWHKYWYWSHLLCLVRPTCYTHNVGSWKHSDYLAFC